MKKTICIVLVLAICLSVTACGGKAGPAVTTETTAAPSESTTEATFAPTEPATEPSEETEPPIPEPEELVAGALAKALESHTYSYYSDTLYLAYLAGYVAEVSNSLYSYGHGADYIGKFEQNITENTGGEITEFTVTETYKDGLYTYFRDDTEESYEDDSLDPANLEKSFLKELDDLTVRWEYVSDVTVEDLGSRYYMAFTYGEDAYTKLADFFCDAVGINRKAVDVLTESHALTSAGGYALVEKATGALLAFNENITFEYAYEGETIPQIYDFFLQVEPDSYSAYKEITDTDGPVAEPEEKATPVFYHVTGQSGQEMWLLGTIHIGDERTSYLPEELYQAFDNADALAVEVDTERMSRLMDEDEEFADEMRANFYYEDGSEITDHIEESVYEDAVEAMKRAGLYRFYLDSLTAAVWSSELDNSLMDLCELKYDFGVDSRLISRAYAQEKEVISLEAFEDHLAIGLGCSDRLQQLLLISSLEQDPVEYLDSCLEMFEIWCRGDEAEIIAYFQEEDQEDPEDEWIPEGYTEEEMETLNQEYDTYMIGDRNPLMLQKAIDFLESGRVIFYCVGLAHVLGDQNLVDGLREAGYTVELVEFSR